MRHRNRTLEMMALKSTTVQKPTTIEARCAAAGMRMTDSHHDHLINLRDGQVIEFTSDEIEKLQAEVARKLGYRLVDHRLELYCVPMDDE